MIIAKSVKPFSRVSPKTLVLEVGLWSVHLIQERNGENENYSTEITGGVTDHEMYWKDCIIYSN